jgi:hypothetical protein
MKGKANFGYGGLFEGGAGLVRKFLTMRRSVRRNYSEKLSP